MGTNQSTVYPIGTAWDGYSLTQRVNEGHTLGNWEFFFSRK